MGACEIEKVEVGEKKDENDSWKRLCLSSFFFALRLSA